MRFRTKWIGVIFIGLLIFGSGCNKKTETSTTPDQTSKWNGVWEGFWHSTQNASEGILCMEIHESGENITATVHIIVTGKIEGFSGHSSDEGFTISNQANWEFTATGSTTQVTGEYTAPDDRGTWEAQKQPVKSSCEWVESDVRNRFRTILSSVRDARTGRSLASFVTAVPFEDVKINDKTAPDWWISIWEVDDRVQMQRYTAGAAFGQHPTGSTDAGIGWLSTTIHSQYSNIFARSFFDEDLSNGFGTPGPDVYGATNGVYSINADADPNYNRPILYRSPCEGGQQFVVRMTELTGSFVMTGRNINGRTVDIRIPPDGEFQDLGALHVLIRQCS